MLANVRNERFDTLNGAFLFFKVLGFVYGRRYGMTDSRTYGQSHDNQIL